MAWNLDADLDQIRQSVARLVTITSDLASSMEAVTGTLTKLAASQSMLPDARSVDLPLTPATLMDTIVTAASNFVIPQFSRLTALVPVGGTLIITQQIPSGYTAFLSNLSLMLDTYSASFMVSLAVDTNPPSLMAVPLNFPLTMSAGLVEHSLVFTLVNNDTVATMFTYETQVTMVDNGYMQNVVRPIMEGQAALFDVLASHMKDLTSAGGYKGG